MFAKIYLSRGICSLCLLLIYLSLCFFLTGCANIRMKVISARVALTKKDGTNWDGMGNKWKESLAENADLASTATPYAQFLKLAPLIPENARPDPIVIVRILENGKVLRKTQTDAFRDEYCPIYNHIYAFRIAQDISNYEVEITILDEDLINNDAIGTITVPLAKMLEQKETTLKNFDSVCEIKLAFYKLDVD